MKGSSGSGVTPGALAGSASRAIASTACSSASLSVLLVLAVAEHAEVAGDAAVAVDRDPREHLLALLEAEPLEVEVREADAVGRVRRVLAVVGGHRLREALEVLGDLAGVSHRSRGGYRGRAIAIAIDYAPRPDERSSMAYLITHFWPGATEEQYRATVAVVHPPGGLPEGQLYHAAGPTDGGFLIAAVWDSKDRYDTFLREKLIASMPIDGGFSGQPDERTAELANVQTA